MKNELVHRAGIAEAHFDLGRVHVHVDVRRIDLEVQHVSGMALVVQHVLVGLPDRVREQAVAHVASVHEDVLRFARRAGVLGRADAAVEADRPRGFVERQRRALKFGAEDARDALARRLRFQVPARAAVVLERERGVAAARARRA